MARLKQSARKQKNRVVRPPGQMPRNVLPAGQSKQEVTRPAETSNSSAKGNARVKVLSIDSDLSPGLKQIVRTQQHEHKGLSVAQILENLIVTKGAYYKQAVKVLEAHNIQLTKSVVKAETSDGFWIRVSKEKKVPLINFVLDSTRSSRPALAIADIIRWSEQKSTEGSKKSSAGLTTHVQQILDRHIRKSCEDVLLALIDNTGGDYNAKAISFLFEVIRNRPDMQMDRSIIEDWAQTFAYAKPATRSTTREQANSRSEDADDELDEYNTDTQSDADMAIDEPKRAKVHSDGRIMMEDDLDSRTASWVSINKVPQKATPQPSSSQTGSLQLFQLSPEMQKIQKRYFGQTHPTDPVICTTCGVTGHFPKTCATLECNTCGGNHPEAYCSQKHKCTRCRQRGHSALRCSRPSVPAGMIGDECDICGKTGHAEEECSGLWCSFDKSQAKKIEPKMMIASCYKCGGEHWGDDCPFISSTIRQRISFCSTFSAANAAKFIKSSDSTDTDSDQQHNGSLPAYQLRQLDGF